MKNVSEYNLSVDCQKNDVDLERTVCLKISDILGLVLRPGILFAYCWWVRGERASSYFAMEEVLCVDEKDSHGSC